MAQHLHVLVVDDEAVVRKIVGEYLKIDGHIVEAANSGHDGLEKFRNSRFDLVLVDRAMPDMSGDQVAAAIKSANPPMPVIMLTGFGSMMEAADEKPTRRGLHRRKARDDQCVARRPVQGGCVRELISSSNYTVINRGGIRL